MKEKKLEISLKVIQIIFDKNPKNARGDRYVDDRSMRWKKRMS